jgi:hypothetical protein
VTGPPADHDWGDYRQAVRDYLAYCQLAAAELDAAGSALDPKHHPTAAGAVKMIPHGSDPAEAAKIRQAFDAALMPRLLRPSSAEVELEI